MRCSSSLGVPRRTELRGVNHRLPSLTALWREPPPAWPGKAAQTLGMWSVMGLMELELHRCRPGEEEHLWKALSPQALAASPNSTTGTAERWRN